MPTKTQSLPLNPTPKNKESNKENVAPVTAPSASSHIFCNDEEDNENAKHDDGLEAASIQSRDSRVFNFDEY